jgi:hypothetical protein
VSFATLTPSRLNSLATLGSDLTKPLDDKCQTTSQAAKKAVADGVEYYFSTLRSRVSELETSVSQLKYQTQDLAVFAKCKDHRANSDAHARVEDLAKR